MDYRIEKDTMGEVKVPATAYYGAQTQRSIDNFQIAQDINKMPKEIIRAFAYLKKAAAIITNKGGRTCHAAIVAREMGVPAIVACGNATEVLNEGQMITASCAEGDEGFIYDGALAFETIETNLHDLAKIETPLMLNVGSPANALHYAGLTNKGVGLAREEFIIKNYIGVNPLALFGHQTINDADLSKKIK